ncbi:DUF2783 domain-containing protein [Ruegeria arenilitoris]|uniref:DUF2783 domain-containing protein n=1 Tax=Ruegeria arenilitoris TaxID=1173585 RepID=UPI00147EE19E|nr:DUF2783 domain-containing protein [Ruegeria arenilitoris]
MAQVDIETVYEAIAKSIDLVGPQQSEHFLARLALLLSQESDSTEKVLSLVKQAGSLQE